MYIPTDSSRPQDWTDERLTWDKEVSELTDIVIDGGSIWKPEFAIINGLEQGVIIFTRIFVNLCTRDSTLSRHIHINNYYFTFTHYILITYYRVIRIE